MDSKAAWSSALERVDGLTLRERLLLFGAFVVVTYTAIVVGLIRPLEHKAQGVASRLAAAHSQTAAIDVRLDRVLAPAAQVREAAIQRRLTRRVAKLKNHLGRLTAGLVPAHDMPALMRHVLAAAPGVTLVSLVNHATVPIRRSPKSRPFLYRHEMTLVVRGSYPALVHYLTALTQTKRRVLWGRVTLAAHHYPFSTVRLHLYTLSAREALLR